MGIDVERFVDPPDAELLCAVCCDVVDEAVRTPCDHVFCQACIQRALHHSAGACPTCRARTRLGDLAPVRLVRNLVSNLTVRCAQHAKGCPHTFRLADEPAHRAECGEELVACPHPGCRSSPMPRRAVTAHALECERRVVECSNKCGQSFPAQLSALHAVSCPLKPTACPNNCGETTTLQAMPAHLLACGMAVVHCDVAGCGFHARRGREEVWRAHHTESALVHVDLLKRTVQAQQATIEQLRTRLGEGGGGAEEGGKPRPRRPASHHQHHQHHHHRAQGRAVRDVHVLWTFPRPAASSSASLAPATTAALSPFSPSSPPPSTTAALSPFPSSLPSSSPSSSSFSFSFGGPSSPPAPGFSFAPPASSLSSAPSLPSFSFGSFPSSPPSPAPPPLAPAFAPSPFGPPASSSSSSSSLFPPPSLFPSTLPLSSPPSPFVFTPPRSSASSSWLTPAPFPPLSPALSSSSFPSSSSSSFSSFSSSPSSSSSAFAFSFSFSSSSPRL